MSSYQFESWLCGHVTSIHDGSRVKVEEYTPQHARFTDPAGTNVKKNLDRLCPRCYTDKIREKLQDIRTLLIECRGQHDALIMAERRVTALTKYYAQKGQQDANNQTQSTEQHHSLSDLMRNVSALANEACLAAVKDCEAIVDRLYPGHSEAMLNQINVIRRAAVISFETANKTVKEHIAEIMQQTEVMVDDIKTLEKDNARLLDALEPKWAILDSIVKGRLGKWGAREV